MLKGLLIVLPLLLFSCNVTRHNKSSVKTKDTKNDSTNVSRVDSGRVTKNESAIKTNAEWWREILEYAKPDTVENTLQPINHYYPVKIIREGGTMQTQATYINYDSIFKAKVDSMNRANSHTETITTQDNKTTKTTFGLQLILFILGCLVGYEFLRFIVNKFLLKK